MPPPIADGGGSDAPNTATAVLVVLAGVVGGAVKWIYDSWKDTRQSTTKRSDELYNRAVMDGDLARRGEREANARLAVAQHQMTEVKILAVRKLEHIKYLEGILTDRNIPFRKWVAQKIEFPDNGGTPETEATNE